MPTGFSQTAERLSQSGFKVRELIEPADSSVPNSEDLSASLGTQLAALAQPIEDTATFSDKIANDLAELVAQLNALSFAREDVASIASNAFSQSDALNKLVSALPLTSEEVSETARTLQGVATQLSDIQTQQPFTLDELSRGYLQAIEQADSTKQQSLMLAQLAELSKFASGSATDIQALRSFAQQDARLNVYQTKQLNDIVGLLQTVAAENGSLQYSLDDLVAAQSTQTDQQRRQHKETALAADKAHEQAQAQLDHDKDTREEHNKQRDFDLREAQKQQAAQERAEKNASAGGAAEEQSGGTSFLTKLMQSDLAGMREDLIGSALGVFGMSSLTEVVSDSIREKGDQRAEREAEASEKAQGEDADQQASDSEQQDKSFLRILGETTAESLRADLIQTALGSLGLGSLAEPIEEYLQNKAEPTDPQSDPTQTDTQSTAESAQKNKKASDDVEYSEVEKDDNGGYRATRDSNISSTTPIEGLSAGQQSAEQVDIFKKRDTDQAHANSALDKLVTQSAQANDMLKQIVQSVSTNAKSNTTNNNDRREDLSRLNTARSGMSSRTMMMMPQRRMPRGRMTRASMRRGGVMMSAMPMMPASRAATRMQSRSRMMPMASPVMMSMAAPMMTPMAMGMANQQPNLLAPPRAKSQRQSQRRGAAQKGMMSKALSPMMQLSTNPLAGHDGKALVGSTTKLNEKEMDVIAQEMLLIKEMRRTLNRIEAALPDQGIFSSLLGGGGILGALFEAGSELGDLMGGRRRNKRKDRMGRQDVETGRRGRRGGTRGGRVRSLVANTAATTSTAVGGIATSILGGGGGGILDAGAGLLDLASEFVDFGPEEEDFDRERSRRNRKGGGRGGSKGGTRGKFPTRSTGGPSTAGRTPPGPSTGSGKSAGKSAGKRGFKGAAKGIAKGAAKLAPMLLNPVLGAAVLAGSAAYSLYDGWNSAGENFGLEEGQEASLGQKMSSAAGSLISDVSFGLLDGGSVSRGIHSLGSTVGGWFGFGDDEEEALPSSSEKIANSEIAVPNVPMEVLNEDALPSPETLATGAALASTSLAPGTSLPDEKVAQLVQQHQTLNKATGTPPLHSRMTDATKAALTTAQVSPNKAALDSADKSGATSLATEGDKPSLASRMMDAAKTAVSYTPIGMMATAASNLFSSDDSGAATVTAENEKPSIASRMMDAAKTAVSYTPIGMMATAASNLFSSDDSGAATVTAENEKPSIAS
ncbi:hypothetical protein, partial [Pseudoalteromonas umbrosa]|uniref:hypothetical protein n=1 Tax=Pseudoalteromonas umbrosa TaxID=3048489 RepID=UPI0024C31D47